MYHNMNPLFLLLLLVFSECEKAASAENVASSPSALEVNPENSKNLHSCPGQVIKILCKNHEGLTGAKVMLLADCYMVNIGDKKDTDLQGENLLLKVEKNDTVNDEVSSHFTVKLQFQIECGATGEYIDAIFKFLTDINERDFDPCQYLDNALMITALASTLVIVQLFVYFLTKQP